MSIFYNIFPKLNHVGRSLKNQYRTLLILTCSNFMNNLVNLIKQSDKNNFVYERSAPS